MAAELEEGMIVDFGMRRVDKSQIESMIARALEQKKLCTIDTKSIFDNDPSWKDFFLSIGNATLK